jgi:hypothetical protein
MRAAFSLYEHPDLSADYYDWENPKKGTNVRSALVAGTLCVTALAAVAYFSVSSDSASWGFFEKNMDVLHSRWAGKLTGRTF